MNGRAARRIRRAAVSMNFANGSGEFRPSVKQLKREYKAKPYHKRKGIGYVVLSHKRQERRWIDYMKF